MSGEAVPGSTARLNDLLDAIGECDRPALEELCRLTQPKLYGVALRILRRPELAEQALRDAYLHIWHDASAYDVAALAGLSEDLRRMLLLAYYDGWSRRALAAEFDAPVGTVATWLRRSLGQLRGDR
jgi:RNA polymerase sigma-70 factor (ECF subfamily)